MPTHLTAHLVDQETVTLVALVWKTMATPGPLLPELGPLELVVTGIGTTRVWPMPEDVWTVLDYVHGAAVNRGGVVTHSVRVSGLLPDTAYQAALRPPATPNQPLAQCQFETIPRRLPTDLEAVHGSERPFTMLLGSCYYYGDDDDNSVGRAAQWLRNHPEHRPHLNVLMGDQVYIDQPPDRFGFASNTTTVALRQHVADVYTMSWARLAPLLTGGLNVLTCDDHEYWNDYPNAPPLVWGKLSTNPHTRQTMANIANEFVQRVQQVAPRTEVIIGPPGHPDLKVFVLDTRMHRSTGTDRFCRPEDLEAVTTWLDTLPCPGVLVVGAPIFAPAYGRFGKDYVGVDFINSDHNLPAFTDDYRRLTNALARCKHDVLVCAGDVHFGRVSTVRLPVTDAKPATNLWEVVSSPMTCLPRAQALFTAPEAHDPGGYPVFFPPPTEEQAQQGHWPRIKYLKAVPALPALPVIGTRGSENHLMTLGFRRGTGAEVHVDVRAWLVNRKNPKGGPQDIHMHHIVLDPGRPRRLSSAALGALGQTATLPAPQRNVVSTPGILPPMPIVAAHLTPPVILPAIP